MRNKKIFIIALLMVVVLIGVGYANITNRTLKINGTAEATPDDANFIVRFLDEDEGENLVTTDGGATAEVEDDDTAIFTVTGLTAKGQSASATYTIANESTGLEAALSAVVSENSNSQDFDVQYYFDDSQEATETILRSNNTTTVTVVVRLKTTPVDSNLSTTVKLDITAAPQVELENN